MTLTKQIEVTNISMVSGYLLVRIPNPKDAINK